MRLALCCGKKESRAQSTLPWKDEQILAARYQMDLPAEEELRAELAREREGAERTSRLSALEAKGSAR